LPLVVRLLVGAGNIFGTFSSDSKRDSLSFSAGVVSTANGDLLGEPVVDLDVDFADTWDTEQGRKFRVGEVQLAVGALETTNRLRRGALESGPLRLLVARWAGVRAEHAFTTAVGSTAGAAGHGLNVVVAGLVLCAWVLNTNPTTDVHVVDVECAIVRGEV